jgi:hypothetical protein
LDNSKDSNDIEQIILKKFMKHIKRWKKLKKTEIS